MSGVVVGEFKDGQWHGDASGSFVIPPPSAEYGEKNNVATAQDNAKCTSDGSHQL